MLRMTLYPFTIATDWLQIFTKMFLNNKGTAAEDIMC